MLFDKLSLAIQFVYLFSVILFIMGIKRLSSPATARSGNQLAAVSMLIVIIATLLDRQIVSFSLILVGILIGGALGLLMAYRVKITDMPQVVAIFNGVGGGAAALVEMSEFFHRYFLHATFPLSVFLPMLIGTVIGCVTFTGSLIAFGKLQGILSPRASTSFLLKMLTAAMGLVIVITFVQLLIAQGSSIYLMLIAASLIFGVVMVVPIGGADMPVVISLLNSYTGLSVAFAGFVLQNNVLIVSGTLVGASGTLLTQLMCKAMNRSLMNVLFGAFGAVSGSAGVAVAGAKGSNGSIRDISVDDAAILLAYARNVIVVPGYGLAVAQAQHQVRDLASALEARNVNVKYAIHPVAGRMPGHMNVLLAEANIPYSQLAEMDEINPEFPRTNVVLVIGANDVVNPAARLSKESPIYGMPILDVDQAEKVIVLKRSMNPGFAGIENQLFYDPKTYMLFGDARESITKLIAAVKSA